MRTWLHREEVEQLVAVAVADALERAAGAVAVLRTKQSQRQGTNLAWYMLAIRQAEEAVRAVTTEYSDELMRVLMRRMDDRDCTKKSRSTLPRQAHPGPAESRGRDHPGACRLSEGGRETTAHHPIHSCRVEGDQG